MTFVCPAAWLQLRFDLPGVAQGWGKVTGKSFPPQHAAGQQLVLLTWQLNKILQTEPHEDAEEAFLGKRIFSRQWSDENTWLEAKNLK